MEKSPEAWKHEQDLTRILSDMRVLMNEKLARVEGAIKNNQESIKSLCSARDSGKISEEQLGEQIIPIINERHNLEVARARFVEDLSHSA